MEIARPSTADGQRMAIKKALQSSGLRKISDELLIKCVGISTALQLTPEQLGESWEAFSLTKNISELTEHNFASYRTELIKHSSVPNTASAGAVVNRNGKRPNHDYSNVVTPPPKKAVSRTPAGGQSWPGSASSSVSRTLDVGAPATRGPTYDERAGAGTVVATYKPSNFAPVERIAPTEDRRCRISTDDIRTNTTKPYRHMFTTLADRAKCLDEHLDIMSEAITEKYGIGPGEGSIAPLEAVGIPSQSKITCVGRICNEAHNGKLNAASIVLEGARGTSGGARINVDLTQMKRDKTAYSLFPGQIVAIEGMNPTGRKLIAERIWEGAAQPMATSSVKEMRKHVAKQDDMPLRVMVANGPYTTSDDTEYKPWVDLMSNVMETAPDVVVLSGPFLDTRQKAIRTGHTKLELEDGDALIVPYEVFFANKIASYIEEVVRTKEEEGEAFHTQFVLIPSIDDAVSEVVYPQAPLTDRVKGGGHEDSIPGGGLEIGTLGLDRINKSFKQAKIMCLSNPCTFKINETVFGMTSNDTLFHLSMEQTNEFLPPGSRLKRIAEHVIKQRSYYPLFPAPANLPINLDLKKMDKMRLPCQPDILILPSKLATFAAAVSNTVIVNPGYLSRGTTGGTYAILHINPVNRDSLDNAGADDVQVPHDIVNRTMVEVKKI